MGFFSRKEMASASKVSADARYVDADVQRVDVTIKDVDGDSVVVEFSLDQVRKLIGELTIAYSVCRPSLLRQREAERIAMRLGMR
jgi:hypothetical protein